jgi:hypothetical protein
MDGQMLQTLAAGGIVLAAALFLGRRWVMVAAASVRARKDGGAAGCAGGCGCASKH